MALSYGPETLQTNRGSGIARGRRAGERENQHGLGDTCRPWRARRRQGHARAVRRDDRRRIGPGGARCRSAR